MKSTFYIQFIDDDGSDAEVFIEAPNEDVARRAIGPRRIERIVDLGTTGLVTRTDESALHQMASRIGEEDAWHT